MINFLTRESLCDGYQDCLDNEDERAGFCRTFKCGKNRFKCKKGPSYQCIHIVSRGQHKLKKNFIVTFVDPLRRLCLRWYYSL